jgi:hypothetical protein
MTEPHTATGDQDIRQHILDSWTHIALIDDQGGEETRIDIAADSRAQWLDDASQNPIRVQLDISGGDSDIATPVTIDRTELYLSDSATNALSGDDFDEGPATLGADADFVTVTHNVEQPELGG